MEQPDFASRGDRSRDIDLKSLFHPAAAVAHPQAVIEDHDLTLDEKRAILASWASDACAVEAAPSLRRPPGSLRPVPVDEILEALQALDRLAERRTVDPGKARRVARRPRFDAGPEERRDEGRSSMAA